MTEPIKEPVKGEPILEWGRRLAREVARLARMLNVSGDGGLEVVGGTLRCVPNRRSSLWAKTPALGIDAAVSASKPSSAVCRRYRLDKNMTPPELVDAGNDVTVWNQCGVIGGNLIVQCKVIDGDYVVDVACC